jgi:hypothetical protein
MKTENSPPQTHVTMKTTIPIEILARYSDSDRRALKHAEFLLHLLAKRIDALRKESETWLTNMLPHQLVHGPEVESLTRALESAVAATSELRTAVDEVNRASSSREVRWYRLSKANDGS